MIFAGDEIGLTGQWGEDSRTPYPWHAPETWDEEILEKYKTLIYLRTSSDAFIRGGLQYIQTGDDYIAYLRESQTDRVLVLVTREKVGKVHFDAEALGVAQVTKLIGFDAEFTGKKIVVDVGSAGAGVWRLS
jgi:alpha-glucosidase